MEIAVITYQAPHRKTQDLLMKLTMYYPDDYFYVFGLPWKPTPPRQVLFPHRPPVNINVGPEKLCKAFPNAFYYAVDDMKDLGLLIQTYTRAKTVFIAGAGILKFPEMDDFNIINAHPGHLPHVPGLDALKWAILHGQPIGVTTHFIDRKVDEGVLIERKFVPVYFEDSFYNVAMRQYDIEIEMLARSIQKIQGQKFTENLYNPGIKPNGRMPMYLEPRMMARFEAIRINSPSKLQTK